MTDRTHLQVQSLITSEGKLKLSLARVPYPVPGKNEVLVRIEASPINPSDLGLLFGPADMKTAKVTTENGLPLLIADVSPGALKAVGGRIDQPMPVGNEGAGTVVEAGDAPEAQALMGKMVGILGGAMYGQYRVLPVEQCLLLEDGTTAAEGASCFVNPLTALGMVETMRAEGHRALVHTAAASNLGQMLHRICEQDGVPLVNIVRKPEQVALLKSMGAKHVCDSSQADFMHQLTQALDETDATVAFDAIGGGELASQILNAMEAAQLKKSKVYSRYGTSIHKQVYLYGGLDTQPTVLKRGFGMSWSVGGWLLFNFIQKIGPARYAELKARVARELKTTFASSYAGELSLTELFEAEKIAHYAGRSTGKKYLINPSKT
jgi:NADPH2:quinone reductase